MTTSQTDLRALGAPTPRDPAAAQRAVTASDPRWTRPAFWALLVGTAALYLVNLTTSGYANAFYSAAVQAGSTSWEAFFYGSLDAANSITVDKPPAALWVMALSVRLFGLSSFAILVPEVLMGVATVGVLYVTVKRAFGARAGLLAGLILALTPVAALMFRFNNPDALLTLLMTAAAWATLRAIEVSAVRASARWMALAGVFLGLGFLTKSLQVMLVVPALGLAYLVAARVSLGRRVLGGLIGIVAMVLTAGWWVAVVELVPASARPYIGGSQTNSFLELTFGYNGLGRLSGNETGSVTGGGGGPGGAGAGMWGETGIGRLFNQTSGGQISWLIPAALILLVAGLWLRRGTPRTDLRRAGYLVWGGWLLVTGLTFSYMAGIFHDYYDIALAPAVAALVAMGGVDAWQRRAGWGGRTALALATAATAAWGYVLLTRVSEHYGPLRHIVLVVGLAAAALMYFADELRGAVATALVGAAVAAGLAGPAAYTATTIATAQTGSIVTAGPATGFGPGGGAGPTGARPGPAPGAVGPNAQGRNGFGGAGQPGGQLGGGAPGGGAGGLLDASTPSAEVVAALTQDADRYTWVAAAVGSQRAAGLQLGSQLPVMAIGGFNGSDPSPTLAQFQGYVAAGRIHYFAAGGLGGGQRANGGSDASSEITAWVQENFTAVNIGEQTFYDLSQPVSGGVVEAVQA